MFQVERIRQKEFPPEVLQGLVEIHRDCFPRDVLKEEDRAVLLQSWNNPPVMNYWILREKAKIVAYIRWVEHGGIRSDAIIELEQIGVHQDHRGQKLGTRIIDDSLYELALFLHQTNRRIKLVYLTTAINNFAQKLYQKTLGTLEISSIPSFYDDSHEVIMLAHLEQIKEVRRIRKLPWIS